MADDRHGRVARADNDRRRRPSDGFRVRDLARFEQVAEEAIGTLPDELLEAVEDAELVVTDVPPPDVEPVDEVPLAAVTLRRGRRSAVVTVYRRPLEARALSRLDLAELVREAVGREVAGALGLDFDELDGFDED